MSQKSFLTGAFQDLHGNSKAMIEKLVGFDTTSSKSNLELISFVESYLASLGISSRRTTNSEQTKANLFATIGPDIAGGIVLSGHTDVVPVEDQVWTSDPFHLHEKDGRLYGRGTADMKSFLAVALAMVPTFQEKKLLRPIHLALSYDEEVGCLGVKGLIDDLKANLPLPRLAIIGEPTEMGLVSSHKTLTGFEVTIHGLAAHSSLPEKGASAIMAAARLIEFLHRLSEEKRKGDIQDKAFDPPYTTFQVGTIKGGTAINVIPQECTFVWEFRALPGEDSAELIRQFEDFCFHQVLADMRRSAPQSDIQIRNLTHVPGLKPEQDGAAERLVRSLSGLNSSQAVSYATEGGHFQNAGLSTVIYGPGSINVAHQANEYIELEQIAACEAFLRKLGDFAAGNIAVDGL